MTGTEIELPVDDGVLAAVDFGGQGPPVLLVHGSGHNAAAWTDVAARLVPHCHPVAIDLRGHGQTPLDSRLPEQYWRDLGRVVAALGWSRPLLVGHSTGGYAVTAATAAGLVDPAALCVVDGVVLDDRATAVAAQARWRTPAATQRLRATFRYGWTADDEEMRDYVEQCVRQAPDDWLNAGSRPELVRAVTRRGFLSRGTRWIRRPTIEEIGIVGSPDPDATIYPSVDLYERVTAPLTIVLASDGFYASRRAEVRAVTDAGADRHLVDIASNHNVPMTRPDDLATVILDLLARPDPPAPGSTR
jgi:pimeloyl-ACP methyl ester carboxylesterase